MEVKRYAQEEFDNIDAGDKLVYCGKGSVAGDGYIQGKAYTVFGTNSRAVVDEYGNVEGVELDEDGTIITDELIGPFVLLEDYVEDTYEEEKEDARDPLTVTLKVTDDQVDAIVIQQIQLARDYAREDIEKKVTGAYIHEEDYKEAIIRLTACDTILRYYGVSDD